MERWLDRCRRLPAGLALGCIKAYRYALSPWLGARCRHVPSCSAYAEEAIAKHGLARGGRLAAVRIARCHPWGTFGYDPVPDAAPRRPAR